MTNYYDWPAVDLLSEVYNVVMAADILGKDRQAVEDILDKTAEQIYDAPEALFHAMEALDEGIEIGVIGHVAAACYQARTAALMNEAFRSRYNGDETAAAAAAAHFVLEKGAALEQVGTTAGKLLALRGVQTSDSDLSHLLDFYIRGGQAVAH